VNWNKTMKSIGTILAFVFVGFFGVTGGMLFVSESIPDNAKIWVYPSREMWSPDSWFMDRDFEEQLQDPERSDGAKQWLNDRQPGIYADVMPGGRCAGYKAFPVLLEEPGNIMIGWNGSLLLSWFLEKPRWNNDGTWNW